MMHKQKAIIIGAGPAGLTAAYELLTKTDIIPIVIESDTQVGGLSKTVDYKGNKIDLGGHRFFSKSEKVIQWWLNILPLEKNSASENINIKYHNQSTIITLDTTDHNDGDMMIRSRKSRIYYRRKFFDYPLQLNWKTAKNLGFGKMISIGLSYMKAKFFPVQPEVNLADFFVNRFGKSLYETFFKDYTEKVWGVPCDSLPATWGQQRIKDLSVSKVIWHAVKNIFSSDTTINQTETSTSLIEQFLYPQSGPGQMWETVAKRVVEMGGTIIMDHAALETFIGEDCLVKSIKIRNNITKEIMELNGDYFFSTMPVKELIAGLNFKKLPDDVRKAAASLEYRDFLIVGILALRMNLKKEEQNLTDNWIYIQDKNILAGRMQLFHNWSPYMITDTTKVWIGVEFFCNETDRFWNESDEKISSTAICEMEQIGLLNKNDVLDTVVIKAPKAYPSYFGGYENFEHIKTFTDTIDNLFLIGRNGMHKYNNTDHSMLTAMTAVDNILTGRKDKSNIWNINTEDEYHEEKS
jgi:protoporphyrinogen oxidase